MVKRGNGEIKVEGKVGMSARRLIYFSSKLFSSVSLASL